MTSERWPVNQAARLFVEQCLLTDGSLFSTGQEIWTEHNSELLLSGLPLPDHAGATLTRVLYESLDQWPNSTVQYAAELLYIYYLLQDVGYPQKFQVISEVLHPLRSRPNGTNVRVPPELLSALELGPDSDRFTIGHHSHRSTQVRFLAEFVYRWKPLSPDEKQQLLKDPHRLEAFLHSTAWHDDEGLAEKQSQALSYLITELGQLHGWAHKDSQATVVNNYQAIPEDPLISLATDLMLPIDHLRKVKRLLADKKQAIFYGPPGTGKTYVARELAKYFARDGGTVDIVQFHPSYAYEDFIEGLRPVEVEGETRFRVVDGPLKRIAEQARQAPEATHVLLIDEINRGNLSKVLGELYFLLEYRDEAITLQYSADEFALPENLWIIGTVNTADRSIALVDAALRRRFFFVGFFPDEEPIDGLLRRWLERNNPDYLWVADVVDEANRRLDDRHLAIGPSYFMKDDLDEEWLEIIWEHQVIPYLAEQFFGEEARLDEFHLKNLRRQQVPELPEESDTAEE